MSALLQYKQLADTQSIIEWCEHSSFSKMQLDCLTALMLKILDDKCHMDETHQDVIKAMYSVTGERAGDFFDSDIHLFIQQVLRDSSPVLDGYIHELRLYAESAIPKQKMKSFKQFLWDSIYL